MDFSPTRGSNPAILKLCEDFSPNVDEKDAFLCAKISDALH
jgi:hypothetical protein